MPNKKKKIKFKKGQFVKRPSGVAHIQSTYNNTIITIINIRGKVISWSSGGAGGFKGTKKSTAFAAKIAAEMVAKKSIDKNVKRVTVLVKGTGPGRKTAIRALVDTGLKLSLIRDMTGTPHNGCRQPKKRRI